MLYTGHSLKEGGRSTNTTGIQQWFRKCKVGLSGPRPGQVFIPRQSENTNLFIASGSGGRVLIWSPERGLRWQSRQWFRSRHASVFSREKEPIQVNLHIRDKSGELLSERQIAFIAETQMSVLKTGLAEHKERLASQLNDLE